MIETSELASGEAGVPVVRRWVDPRESTLLMNSSRQRQVLISSGSPFFQMMEMWVMIKYEVGCHGYKEWHPHYLDLRV